MHVDSIYFFYKFLYTSWLYIFPLLIKIFYNTLNTKKVFILHWSFMIYLHIEEVSTMQDKVLAQLQKKKKKKKNIK